jgi:chromosome segregation ATPase
MGWVEEFAEITKKTHTEQAQWWLNGFWKEGAEGYKEEIWKICHQFVECQIGGPVLYGSKKQDIKENSDLDELKSHRILEVMGETLTVVALRARLKKLDIDNNNRMAISEYLLDKYGKTPQQLCAAPQGDLDPKLLAAAEDACERAGSALDQAASDAEAAEKAKRAAESALAAAQKAEAEVRAAEAELQSAINEIEKLENERRDKVAKCQAIIDDPNSGAVKKGKAVQEKEQTLGEDPLPLRKAKLTQQASLRKVEKARLVAEQETAKSAEAAAEAARTKEAADAAKRAAEEALAAAQAQLEALKKKGGTPMGKLWWMERVLQEKKKFTK